MTVAASPLLYPLINGVRHSYASIEIRFATYVLYGYKSIVYSRERNRAMVYGTNSDPIAKTRGFNMYNAELECYLAEFNFLQRALQAVAEATVQGAGPKNGYGDVQFLVTATYLENGLDIITDTLINCTMDTTDASHAQSPDALVRKFKLNPTKILYNGIDDSAQPLIAPPGT